MAVEGEFPSLDGATEWLNSEPLNPAGLRGRVVLVEFGTFTCINWLRTLPHVRAWANRYREQGLVVVVVQTPEFQVEHNVEDVRRAMTDLRVDFPIAIDNDYAIWNAFDNRYWPALYFIDAQGRIRHHQFGEGGYEQSERVLQQILTEAGADNVDTDVVSVDGQGIEAAADWASLQSPETYVGYERGERFASLGRTELNERQSYTVPAQLHLNDWALAGDWTIEQQAAVSNGPSGRIVYRFHARDVHLAMGPGARGTLIRFRVLIDGQGPDGAHGLDTDDQGRGTVTGLRLYQLVRQSEPIADRLCEIQFVDPGVEALVFTFG
jgi:thiol-disulfide isomerase/thioredoxin